MKLTKQEWLLLIFISTLFLAWSSLPNWAGYALQNKELSFTGTFFDTRDYAVHIAMLRAGTQGELAYSFRFTTEPHQAYYIRMFYLVLGQVNRIFHADPELVFQIAKWVFGYLALFSLFSLSKRVFASAREQWLAFTLTVMGAGLGYVQMIFGWIPGPTPPVDLWLIDPYYFFSLTLFPHFAFTLALMCLSLAIYFDFLRSGGWRKIVFIVIAALLVQSVNPIAFAVVDVTMATATLVVWVRSSQLKRNQFAALVGIALSQIPLLLYNFILLNNDPIWSQFMAQNETLSPPPIYYVWGFGLFWPLVIFGGVRAWRERNPILLACLAWIITAFALAYAPFAIQRRFLLGVTIPLAFLAAHALAWIFERLSKYNPWVSRRIPLFALLSVMLISMTSLIFIPAYTLYMQARPAEYYYPRALDDAFRWMTANTGPNDFVLGVEDTGRLTAQKTGRRVYLGHVMETLNYETKVEEVAAYYRNELPPDWLTKVSIQWVIYGPYEREIAPNFQPNDGLELIYQSDGIQIYKVRTFACTCPSTTPHTCLICLANHGRCQGEQRLRSGRRFSSLSGVRTGFSSERSRSAPFKRKS